MEDSVADNSTKHTQKEACKDKPFSKRSRRPSLKLYTPKPYFKNSYEVPPRFLKPVERKLEQSTYSRLLHNKLEASNQPPRVSEPKTASSPCNKLEASNQPPQVTKPKSASSPAFETQADAYRKSMQTKLEAYKLPPGLSEPTMPKHKFVKKHYSYSKTIWKMCAKEEVVSLVQYFQNELAIKDLLHEYNLMFNKRLVFVKYGYSTIEDLIKDIPDLHVHFKSNEAFVRYGSQNLQTNKVKSADGLSTTSNLPRGSLADEAILNIRKILESCLEGIKVKEVIETYNTNCRHPLDPWDYGCKTLVSLLDSIKSRVPFSYGFIDGDLCIYPVKCNDKNANSGRILEVCEDEAIPFDAAFPDFVYEPQTFPSDFDYTKSIPAYTSEVGHPGNIFLQFQFDSQQADDYKNLHSNMDSFYHGSISDRYKVKDIHIKVGGSYIAKWPTNNIWYRVKIESIPSLENVRVFYVDFGTYMIIPKDLLRYTKEEFKHFPAQAVKCRLAYIRPPNNMSEWEHPKVQNRIIPLCSDVQLMAQLINIEPDGVYSVVLYDVRFEEVCINYLLCNEGLAELEHSKDIPKPSGNISHSELEQSENNNDLEEYGFQVIEAPSVSKAEEDVDEIDDDDEDDEMFLLRKLTTKTQLVKSDEKNNEMKQTNNETKTMKKVSTKAQHVKRVLVGDIYKIHIIIFESQLYASSGDVSLLIWNNKDADYLLQRLQVTEFDVPSLNLSENGNEELFQQLYRFNVKGVQKTTGAKSSVLLYPLKVVIKILNIFGHPSASLRIKLTDQIANFNPSDPQWNELSPNTDPDDNIVMLSLPNLLVMKESLECKRKKIMSSRSVLNSILSDETNKNELMYQRVLQRIEEIKAICNFYA